MSTPTPGPWTAKGYSIWGPKSKETKIGLVANTMSSYPAPECEANARLIAAAPELLEACQCLLRDGDMPEIIELMEQAVAKAEGRG